MLRLSRIHSLLCLLALGLVLGAMSPSLPTASASDGDRAGTATAARAASSLRISPRHYVGGQKIRFRGNIGVRGKRRVHVQLHLGRSGDAWHNISGSGHWTRRDGHFSFRFKAPSMREVYLRVASGRHHTPRRRSNARSQDLVLSMPERVAVGQSFTINVDTVPEIGPRPKNDLNNRPDLDGTPTFTGRPLTLQRRTAPGVWETLDKTVERADDNVNGSFRVTAGAPGEVVYRVVQERLRNGVGWFPSFPTKVIVGGVAPASTDRTAPAATGGAGPVEALPRRAARAGTASGHYKWGRPDWVADWEYGQDLTSHIRGSRRGQWLGDSTGYGRVATQNGGLMVDSQRHIPCNNKDKPECRQLLGDLGTTTATMRRQASKFGRWEAKMRLKSMESRDENYHAVIELVPAADPDAACGVITVADVAVDGSTLGLGVTSPNGDWQWKAAKRYGLEQSRNIAFGVEVGKRHVSWFLNGTLVGSVRNRAAVGRVPRTLRLRLVGQAGQEMNKTQFISDWQRAYTLDRGRQVVSRDRLSRSAGPGC